MAEINDQPTQKKRKGSAIFSTKSLKVDLTPMVDLGFILITFFVFTSSLSEMKAMDIINPNDKDSGTNDALCESCVLTVLPGKDNKIWYYEGMENNAEYKQTSFDATGIRALIAAKKNAVKQQFGEDRFVLIIKPLEKSSFKNMVDIIDECKIGVVLRYYIDVPGPAEQQRFK